MIVAGEASGDKHGASLAGSLARLYPETRIELFGSGGDEMRAAGVETLVDARNVAIIGVPEIVRAFGKLYRAYRTLITAARARRPAAIVLIDWPDFNMRLAKKLHREGFRIIYYVSPQVWAWRRYRIRALRRDVDRMLVILPFEEEFYKNAGVEVEYLGHPLAGRVQASLSREEFCRSHGLDPDRAIIALLPGSRHKEIHYHLPLMLDAAARLRKLRVPFAECALPDSAAVVERNKRSEASLNSEVLERGSQISNLKSQISNPQFIIPLASTVRREDIEATTRKIVDKSTRGDAAAFDLTIIERDTYNALAHSALAIIASGTATVEAALAGTPMVIIYRGSELNWRLIRPLIHLDTFGMVNLIAGRRVVPELIQHDATGGRIALEAAAILEDDSRRSHMIRELDRVRQLLAGEGGSASDRAAMNVIGVVSPR